ncbi:MAG: pyrroloquinoline quinone-dependent dehydrogenase, partial [Gammaproteobacteria bacterium]
MNRYVRLLATTAVLVHGPHAAAESQWTHYAGDQGAQQYSPLDQINADNVADLAVAWQYRSGELARRTEFQNATAKVQVNPILLPAAAGGHLVFCTPFNRLVALDPERGTERWIYDPDIRIGGYATENGPQGLDSPAFANCRGVAYWEDTAAQSRSGCRHRLLMATNDLRLIAVDAASGRLCPGFGNGGIVAVEPEVLAATPAAAVGEVRFSNPPVVVNGVAIVGSGVRDNHRYDAPSGAVRAFDARTGEARWSFDPVPRTPATAARLGWEGDTAAQTGGANVWGMMSADEGRDLVFLPTSGPSPDFFGGTRPGDNRYADSIVALRASTDEVV